MVSIHKTLFPPLQWDGARQPIDGYDQRGFFTLRHRGLVSDFKNQTVKPATKVIQNMDKK